MRRIAMFVLLISTIIFSTEIELMPLGNMVHGLEYKIKGTIKTPIPLDEWAIKCEVYDRYNHLFSKDFIFKFNDINPSYFIDIEHHLNLTIKPLHTLPAGSYIFKMIILYDSTTSTQEFIVTGSGVDIIVPQSKINHKQFKNNICYDIRGRVVQNPRSGLYLINRKKIMRLTHN